MNSAVTVHWSCNTEEIIVVSICPNQKSFYSFSCLVTLNSNIFRVPKEAGNRKARDFKWERGY